MMSGNIDIDKYLKDGKKAIKKNYTLYLNEEATDFIKKNFKVSLSFFVNDFLEHITKSIKEEREKNKKDGEDGK